MKFDLGRLSRGKIVEVSLSGSAANVRLMNGSNLYNYERSRAYEFTGGLIGESSCELHIPNTDRWYIVVDTQELDGLKGSVNATVTVH